MKSKIIQTKLLKFKRPKKLAKGNFSEFGLEIKCLIFKSIDDLNLIIYSGENKSIVCYDINNNQKVNEVLHAHEKDISYLNHYSEKKNRINLMLSISGNDNNLKVWNVSNFECLYNFKKINYQGWINCACFLNDNGQIYVLSTNSIGFIRKPNPIQVFNLKGKKIMDIKNSNKNSYFIDVYYDNKSSTKYIITGNVGFSESYNYNKNAVYHRYDNKNIKLVPNLIIKEGDTVELIESSMDGNIRIWNFHSADLLKTINIGLEDLYSICLWDKDNLLACCNDKIKIIKLNKEWGVSDSNLGNKGLIRIGKVVHSQYGECLVLQTINGFMLWESKN